MKKLYKGKYLISFYDRDGEHFRYLFDNVRDILKFMGKPITRQSVNSINVMLCRALRSNHIVRFLTDEELTVFIIDEEEGEDNESICENSVDEDY